MKYFFNIDIYTMKFGEHLASHLTPEWNSQYVDYEYMKEMLELALATAPPKETNGDNRLREQYFVDVDVSFFQVRIANVAHFIKTSIV